MYHGQALECVCDHGPQSSSTLSIGSGRKKWFSCIVQASNRGSFPSHEHGGDREVWWSSTVIPSHFLQPLQQCRSPSFQFLRVLVPGLNPLSRPVESPPCLRLNPMFLDPMSQALC